MLTIENHQQSVTIACLGQPLLRYQADSAASKPHFDRVALPPTAHGRAGENVVLAGPHDHVWHLGLWFCPSYIDGLSFWETERLASRGQRHGRGRMAGEVRTFVRENGCVGFSQEVSWVASDGEEWIRETRECIARPPAGNAYFVDWTCGLCAVGKDRVWRSGDHSGECANLCFRAPRSMERGAAEVLNSEGASGGAHCRPARWCDFSGKLDANPDPLYPDIAGITLMDHPANPGHPNSWLTMSEPYAMLALMLSHGSDLPLSRDASLRLRFGMLVHYGRADRDVIETRYSEWIDEQVRK